MPIAICNASYFIFFLQINPLHTVPTLNDNGFVLWESRAIAFYLVDTYAPDSPLYPKDTRKRAEVNKLVFFESATFYQAQMAFFRPQWFKKQEPTQEATEVYDKALAGAVSLLGDKKFLTGDTVTLADVGLATSLGIAVDAVEYEGLDKYPKLVEYYKRVKSALPEYEEVACEALQLLKDFISKAKSGHCPHAPSDNK